MLVVVLAGVLLQSLVSCDVAGSSGWSFVTVTCDVGGNSGWSFVTVTCDVVGNSGLSFVSQL